MFCFAFMCVYATINKSWFLTISNMMAACMTFDTCRTPCLTDEHHLLPHLASPLLYWWWLSLIALSCVTSCFVWPAFSVGLCCTGCVWPASSLPACSSPSPFMTGCCLFTTTVSWGICKMCLPVCEHRSLHLISQAVMFSAVRLKQFSVS